MGSPGNGCASRSLPDGGDTSVDIRAGKAAGAQTVGVLCGFGEEAELRQHHADLIISMTVDLAQVLAE